MQDINFWRITMKQRITYLLRKTDSQGGVDPATLEVTKDSLRIPSIDAAKEWRITVGAKEVPQEVHITCFVYFVSCRHP